MYRAVERLEAQKRAREQAARDTEQEYDNEEVVWGGLILDDGTVWDSQLDDAVPLEEYQRTHPGFKDPNKPAPASAKPAATRSSPSCRSRERKESRF